MKSSPIIWSNFSVHGLITTMIRNDSYHLREAIEIDPGFTTAYYQLGWIYRQSG